MYKIVMSKQAVKDSVLLDRAGLSAKSKEFIRIIRVNPYQTPPPYEKLSGNLRGYYSRRINRQHRFVYEVLTNMGKILDKNGDAYDGIVKIVRMWTHYE